MLPTFLHQFVKRAKTFSRLLVVLAALLHTAAEHQTQVEKQARRKLLHFRNLGVQ